MKSVLAWNTSCVRIIITPTIYSFMLRYSVRRFGFSLSYVVSIFINVTVLSRVREKMDLTDKI